MAGMAMRGVTKSNTDLLRDLSDYKALLEQLYKDYKQVESKLQYAESSKSADKAVALQVIKEQSSELRKIKEQLKAKEEEFASLSASNEKVKEELDQINQASNSLEASYEARIKELEEELNANKSDKQRLQEQVSQIKSRIAKITDTEEKEDIEDSLLLIEKEISRLKAESNKAEVQKLENKIAKINNLVPENSRLKAQAKASEQAQWNALGRLAESQKENIKKDKTIRELQAKNNQLEKENAGVKTVERHSAYYKERLEIAEEKKNTATRIVAETKRENDELRKENSDLVDKNLDQKLKNKEQKAIIKKKGKILKFLGIGAGVLLVGGIVLGVFTGKLNKDKKDQAVTIQDQEVTIQDQEDTIINQENTIGETVKEKEDLKIQLSQAEKDLLIENQKTIVIEANGYYENGNTNVNNAEKHKEAYISATDEGVEALSQTTEDSYTTYYNAIQDAKVQADEVRYQLDESFENYKVAVEASNEADIKACESEISEYKADLLEYSENVQTNYDNMIEVSGHSADEWQAMEDEIVRLKQENENKDVIIDEKDEQISNLTSRPIVVSNDNSLCSTIANAYFGGAGAVGDIIVNYNSSTGVAGITFKFRSNITYTETSWQSSIKISPGNGDDDATTLAEVEELMKNKNAALTEEISTETEVEME